MANSHPYISGSGNIAKMVNHLRKSFPPNVSSETVKKLGIASNNESYVINALQFIRVIDDEGKRTEEASKAFKSHKDEDFQKFFKSLVQNAYKNLFDLHGEDGWKLSKDDLITFFRHSDDTSATIGARQAATFQIFSALSGYSDIPAPKTSAPKKIQNTSDTKATTKNSTIVSSKKSEATSKPNKNKDVGLTVRIEINLPPEGTKETYDNIFKSIKENLIDD